MKNLLFLAIIIGLFTTSCKKEEFGYVDVGEDSTYVDTTAWDADYADGGTLQNGTGAENELVGTKWVLVKYVSAFATEYPNDTIEFVSQNDYTINGGAVRTYQLSSIPSSTNYDLQLNFFFPFGGSHYSGQVGGYFVEDGLISNTEFIDIQNTSATIRAWFEKIN